MTEDARCSRHRLDDAFMRAHPHDWATGQRLAAEYTGGVLALLKHYVRPTGVARPSNTSRSPMRRYCRSSTRWSRS